MKHQAPKIISLDTAPIRLIAYPAFVYIESTDSEAKPLCIDNGAVHLGEHHAGVAVCFPARNGGVIYKHFGVCEAEDGSPLAYGKCSVLSASRQPHETLLAAQLDQKVIYKGNAYYVRKAANNNIEFEETQQ